MQRKVERHGDDQAHAAIGQSLALGQAGDKGEEDNQNEGDQKVHALGQKLSTTAEHLHRAQLEGLITVV